MSTFIGILCIVGGIVFLSFDIKTRLDENLDSFDKVEFTRGLIGGIGLLIFGILLLIGWF